eukprot:6176452-Pleurochrysis_carterae.AAC.1
MAAAGSGVSAAHSQCRRTRRLTHSTSRERGSLVSLNSRDAKCVIAGVTDVTHASGHGEERGPRDWHVQCAATVAHAPALQQFISAIHSRAHEKLGSLDKFRSTLRCKYAATSASHQLLSLLEGVKLRGAQPLNVQLTQSLYTQRETDRNGSTWPFKRECVIENGRSSTELAETNEALNTIITRDSSTVH